MEANATCNGIVWSQTADFWSIDIYIYIFVIYVYKYDICIIITNVSSKYLNDLVIIWSKPSECPSFETSKCPMKSATVLGLCTRDGGKATQIHAIFGICVLGGAAFSTHFHAGMVTIDCCSRLHQGSTNSVIFRSTRIARSPLVLKTHSSTFLTAEMVHVELRIRADI